MINNNLHNVLQLVNNHQSNVNGDIKIACNIDKFCGILFFDDFDDINYISQQVQIRSDIFNVSRKDGILTINFRRYSSYGYKITLSEFYRYVRFNFSSKLLRTLENDSKYIDYVEEFFSTIQFNISRDYIRKFMRPNMVEVHVDIFGAAAHRDWIIARKLLIDNVLDDKAANTQKARINKYYNANYETLTINKNDNPLLIHEMLETRSDNDGDKLCSAVKIYDKFYDIMISKFGTSKHWLKVYAQQLFGFNPDEVDYFIDLYSKLSTKERQQVYDELSSKIGITRYEFTLTHSMIKKMCGYKKNPLNAYYSYNIQNCIDFKVNLMLYLINNIWSISKKTRISNRWKVIPIISKTINLLKNDEIITLQPTEPNEEEDKMKKAAKLNKEMKQLKGWYRKMMRDIEDVYPDGYDISSAINDAREIANISTAIFDNIINFNRV